jgi:putative ABC transport system ATP-binding protein
VASTTGRQREMTQTSQTPIESSTCCRPPLRPLIGLVGVERVYTIGDTQVRALDGIDLVIHRGEYVAIMGTSGSGKSTLMNIVGCLDTPTAGSYRFDDRAVQGLDDDALSELRNRSIGFVFQSFHLLPRLTALDNAALPLVYSEVDKSDRQQRAREALERVGLGSRLDHRPNQLSGGQRQRVAIARALINQPSLLLADEPTGNLDSRTSAEIMALLDELSAAGTTVALVTHEADVAAHAQRSIVLRDGRIVEDRANGAPA